MKITVNIEMFLRQSVKKIHFLLLKKKRFTIISNNCWGGFVYQHFKIPYLSPFVGLFIFTPDYINLIEDLKTFLDSELTFIEPEQSRYVSELKKLNTLNTYPVGLLNGVEIHFLHYKTESIAKETWIRRKSRIDYENLIVKMSDRDLCTLSIIERFDKLPFKRKLFLTNKDYSNKSSLKINDSNGSFIKDEWAAFTRTTTPLKCLNKLFKL
jgi:uncharacterized protein (DUF1919 family)